MVATEKHLVLSTLSAIFTLKFQTFIYCIYNIGNRLRTFKLAIAHLIFSYNGFAVFNEGFKSVLLYFS